MTVSRTATHSQHLPKKQLLIDVSVTSRNDAGTGVQRVVRGILRECLLNPPQDYDVLPVRAGRWLGYRYACAYLATFGGSDHARLTGKLRVSRGDIFLALDLTSNILPRHDAEIRRWKCSGLKAYFFVHDLLPMSHPEWFTARAARNYARWLACFARYADGAICTTRSVANELESWVRSSQNPARREIPIGVVPLGADIEATVPSAGLGLHFREVVADMKKSKVVLMVGTIEPRKGYAQALAAFEILWQHGQSVNLAIVGRVGWNVDELVRRVRFHPERGKRLFWFDDVSDEALTQLYALADGILLASEAEGFGLPLIEAARYGKPILARDIPAYREIGAGHVCFFSGRDGASLAREIENWMDLILREATPNSSLIRTSTWADSTRRLYQLILAGD